MHRLPRSLTLRQLHPLTRPARPLRRAHIPRIQARQKSQVFYHASGEPVRLRTVRFKKPAFFTFRRLATVGMYSAVVYVYFNLLWRYMDVEIEFIDDEDEAEQDQLQEGETPEGEEADGPPFYASEASTFIPLTWATPLPRIYYRGSDPEWQTFIAVAKDAARHKKIQNELVQIVYTGSVQHPTISRQLGQNAKVGKYWLDISFPDGPPQEFERSGIEIGDGFVAWSQQRIDADKQGRIWRVLWPQAVGQSTWATVKVLCGIQWRRVKQAVGWEGVDPMAPEERFRAAMEMVGKLEGGGQKGQGEKRGVGKAQTEPNGSPGAVVSRTDSSSITPTDGARPPPTTSKASPSSPDPDRPKLPFLPSVPLPATSTSTPTDDSQPPSTDLPIAMHVFRSTLSRTWSPSPQPGHKPPEPPRGAFVVQGLVEVRGQRGRVMFDVHSAYDPKQAKFVTVSAAVRGVKKWTQGPKGGP